MTVHAEGGEFNVNKNSEAQSKIHFEVTDTPNHVVNGYCTVSQWTTALQYYIDYLVDLDT